MGKRIRGSPIDFLPKSRVRQENRRRKRPDVAQERMKMSEHKDKWYEPYKIVTVLNKNEVETRIRNKAAAVHNFWLFGRERDINEGRFRLYVSTDMVPPRGKNPYLPNARGEIVVDAKGRSIVFVWLELPMKTVLFDLLFYFDLLLWKKGNVLLYALLLFLYAFLLMKYWDFARRRIGEKLEELMEAEDKND